MASPGMRTGRLNVNGGELGYRLYLADSGDLPPLVMIGGWASVMNDWYSLPSELARVGRTVLCFDNRGLGASSEHGGAVGVAEAAADVLALAAALLDGRPFVAVGHSAGGFVAQHLASRSPASVAAVVVLCGQGARATAAAGDAKFFKLGRSAFPDGAELEARMRLFEMLVDPSARDAEGRDFRQLCERSLADRRPAATIQAQLRMLGSADYGPELRAVRCPVLVLHGAQDVIIPPENGRALYDDLVNSRLRRFKVLPGPHVPFGPSLEAGRAAAREIAAFLQEAEGGASKL